MSREIAALLTPRVAIVDDEKQIHASLRLRLGKDYELVSFYDARVALEAVAQQRFDLCLVDIHMPHLDGLSFIEAAKQTDPGLGFLLLSAFDSEENLRRAIPLQVYDFITKPLPERDGFEARFPEWIERTRRHREKLALAAHASGVTQDLDAARLEREVELIASETARDALLQTASLLTTIHAHLVTVTTTLAARARTEPGLAHLLRSLEEARRTADAAVTVAEGFFDSAYGDRDASPALVEPGLRHSINIAVRTSRAEMANKKVDLAAANDSRSIRGLSGIEFLLMAVPAIGAALTLSRANTTVRVASDALARLDLALKEPRWKQCQWLNRRHANTSQPGIFVEITAAAPALSRDQLEAWLTGRHTPLATMTARGLIAGVKKSKGLLGLGAAPAAEQFQLVLALPV